MAITTIFGKDLGSVVGETPSPALTLLYTESHEELPKSSSDGDMAYGMAGEEKGAVYKFKEEGLEWEKVEDGGGSGLPEVTADDNGDVLTVVEGAWAKAAPGSGGGVVIVEAEYTPDSDICVLSKTAREVYDLYSHGALLRVHWHYGDDDAYHDFFC